MHSVVAQWMGLEAPKHAGRVGYRGMAKCPQGYPEIHKMMVQIWGKGRRIGLTPCTDNQIFWFITKKSQPEGNFLYMISTFTSIEFMYYNLKISERTMNVFQY